MDERRKRVGRIAEEQQAWIRALLEDVLIDWLELNLTTAQQWHSAGSA